MLFNDTSLSFVSLASCSAAIHFVLKGGLSLVYFFLLFARFSVMTEIGFNTMCPAIGDFVSVVIPSLRGLSF